MEGKEKERPGREQEGRAGESHGIEYACQDEEGDCKNRTHEFFHSLYMKHPQRITC